MKDPIEAIFEREGGVVDHKADKGGLTNLGITQATLGKWLGRPATREEVVRLTKKDAREIYEKLYLTDPRIHTMPEPLQPVLLDMSVNHGARTAVKLLQRVLNKLGFGPIDPDGVIGPQTREIAQQALDKMGNLLINALVDERIGFYQAIVANNPSQRVFLKGWLNRAEEFRQIG